MHRVRTLYGAETEVRLDGVGRLVQALGCGSVHGRGLVMGGHAGSHREHAQGRGIQQYLMRWPGLFLLAVSIGGGRGSLPLLHSGSIRGGSCNIWHKCGLCVGWQVSLWCLQD